MYRLLLVDDEKMVLVSARHAVAWQQYGFGQILETTDPREALRLLKELRIDAACIDIRMPELSAFDVIGRCRESGIRTTFLILTGYSDFQYAQQALRLGVSDFLLKPLQPEDAGFLPKLAAQVRERRLQEDSLLYQELLQGRDLPQKLCWMGLDPAKPYCGLLFLSGHPKESVPFLPPEYASTAELLLKPDQSVLLFTADSDPTEKLRAFAGAFPAPCGASVFLTGQGGLDRFPAGLAKAKLESEEARNQSALSGSPEFRVHDLQGNQPWNDGFLRLMQEVEKRYAEDLSLAALAEKYSINYSYCSSLFAQRVGTSFSKYISQLRMRRAKELLETTDLPIGVVCEQVGYQDYHHFAKSFKKMFGQTPSEYRTAERGSKP